MPFCLPENLVNEFLKRIKSGDLNPAKLMDMTSAERRAYFGEFMTEMNAAEVNRLLESKLILKNQQLGMINWAKQVSGMKPEMRRDIIARIEKMTEILNPETEKAFYEDLVAHKLGATVTMEEAAKISELAREVTTKREAITEDMANGSKERKAYGEKLMEFNNLLGELKKSEQGLSELLNDPLRSAGEAVVTTSGTAKSLLSTADNSFHGRQGIKTMYTNPILWGKNFIKSWNTAARALGGQNALDIIKAEIYSRKNALNGNYERMKLDIGRVGEEQFPSTLPEKIPLLGRVFKAAEAAFNGSAILLRAELADKYIKLMEEQGIDMKDKVGMADRGKVINALTGRGSLPVGAEYQKVLNATFFSPKYLKAQFDVLSRPFYKGADPFARKMAAQNLLKIVGGIVTVNTIAQMLGVGTAEKDPRSTNFGKIKIGGTTIDTTGGLASLLTLASRLTPTKHNGKWGFWAKNAQTGAWSDLTSGKYGITTALDTFENFFEGKLAPLAGLLRDIWNGSNYNREKVTIGNAIQSLTIPITAQNYEKIMNSPDSDKILMFMILDGLGFSTQTQQKIKKKPKFK